MKQRIKELESEKETLIERLAGEKTADEQRRFERLIADIASNLAQTEPQQLESAIDATLRSLGRFLKTERAFLGRFSDNGKHLRNTNVWTAEGIDISPGFFEIDIAAEVPWAAQQLKSGSVIKAGPGLTGLPDEAKHLRLWLEKRGINSGVVMPVRVEGRTIGMLGLDTSVRPRDYPKSIVDLLKIAANMIGSMLHRVRVQKKLEQYQHIVESTRNPVGFVDSNYVYQYVNDAYCAAFKKTRREIIGCSVADLFGKEMFDSVLKQQYDSCFAGDNADFQTWFEFPGWGNRYMDVRYYPFSESGNDVPAVVVSAHDITDVKRMESKLRESEERFRAFMDNNPASIYIKDENDRHIFGNPAAIKSVGRNPDNFFGSTTKDFFPPEIADRLIELDRKIIKENVTRIAEEWSGSADGEVRWRKDIKFPIRLESGKKLLGGIALDITEQKLAEARLNELMKFDQLLTRISVSFIDIPLEKMDVLINNALEQIGRFFKLDRCSFGHLTQNGKEMRVTHVWNRIPPTGTGTVYSVEQFPWLLSPFRTGRTLVWSRNEGLPEGSDADIQLLQESGMQSFAGVPVKIAGQLSSCLGFSNFTEPRIWDVKIIERFPLVAGIFRNLVARKRSDTSLQKAFGEIKGLKHRLEQENIYLREEIEVRHQHEEIIGNSKAVMRMLGLAEQVAETDSTVLIQGETGTGKELLARAIHRLSRRKDRTMVKVNCAALPATLIESELFGREKGAYTGAMSRQIGRFEIADGSTLFLDEIGELPLELQAKLLRVLQEGQFERLGSPKTVSVNVRIIASTNRDLLKALDEGRFREDLYYRLNVFSITVPPLRDRIDDMPLLIWSFVKEFEKSIGKTIHKIPKNRLEALKHYEWPGNIRELKNVVENAMIVSNHKVLKVNPPAGSSPGMMKKLKLEDIERDHIKNVLKQSAWKVSGKKGAAELLGLKPTTLESKMKKLGIERPK